MTPNEISEFEKEWLKPYKWDEAIEQWFKERPKEIKELMLRFPPAAKVKTKKGVSLMVPAPGKIGIIVSHLESDDGPRLGVTVLGTSIKAYCNPNDLELVEERPGLEIKTLKKVFTTT